MALTQATIMAVGRDGNVINIDVRMEPDMVIRRVSVSGTLTLVQIKNLVIEEMRRYRDEDTLLNRAQQHVGAVISASEIP